MWVVVGVAAVLAVVFFVPVGVEVSLTKSGENPAVGVGVRLQWLAFSWLIGRSRRAPHARKPRDRRKTRRRPFNVRAALTSPGFLRRGLKFVADLGRRARPDEVRVRGRVGFEDPSETGMLVGAMYACYGMPSPSKRWNICVDPEFNGQVLEAHATLRWSRSLASVLWPVLTFIASPVVWRAARAGWN